MSKNIGHLCLMTMAMALLSSCLDSEYTDGTTLYDDIAITSFYISTANMTHHTTSSTGEDSTYVSTGHSMEAYPFYIDQLNGLIYNVDSLPLGIDATKLLCSYGVKNNAYVYIFNQAGDSLRLLQTTDSIDFSYERHLRAYASNGLTYRDYRVRVGVHQQDGDEFRWTSLGHSDTVAGLSAMSLVELGGQMLLLGSDGAQTTVYASATADGTQWTATGATLAADAYQGAVRRGDSLLVLSDGWLLSSKDGATFAPSIEAPGITRLIGHSGTELYAAGPNGEMMAWTEADGWHQDNVDVAPEYMPTQDIACCTASYPYASHTDYVLMVGSRDTRHYPGDEWCMVWRKVVELGEGSDEPKWVMVEHDGYNRYQLPRLASMTVLAYGNTKVAMGMGGLGACHDEPFERIYVSRDQGITWQQNSNYAFPDGFDKSATAYAAAVDEANNIWIVCAGTGQVWRGRLNSMGWAD